MTYYCDFFSSSISEIKKGHVIASAGTDAESMNKHGNEIDF